MKTRLVVIALGLALAGPLAAQQPVAPRPGARVRLVSVRKEVVVEARLVRLAADSVVVTDGRRQQAYALGGPYRLETVVSRSSNAGRGALFGFLTGGAFGALLGGTSGEYGGGFYGGAELGGAVFGVVGLLVGGLLGAASTSVTWAPVSPDGVRIGLSRPTGGRLGVGASFSF